MSTATSALYINLAEAAELELQGCAQRLAIARQALAQFLAEQACTINGHQVLPELRDSVGREHDALVLEVDAAERQYRHSFDEVLRQRATPTPR